MKLTGGHASVLTAAANNHCLSRERSLSDMILRGAQLQMTSCSWASALRAGWELGAPLGIPITSHCSAILSQSNKRDGGVPGWRLAEGDLSGRQEHPAVRGGDRQAKVSVRQGRTRFQNCCSSLSMHVCVVWEAAACEEEQGAQRSQAWTHAP